MKILNIYIRIFENYIDTNVEFSSKIYVEIVSGRIQIYMDLGKSTEMLILNWSDHCNMFDIIKRGINIIDEFDEQLRQEKTCYGGREI